MNLFTKEEQDFIKENVPGNTIFELTKKFNKRFNKHIKENQIKNYKKRNKLKSGINSKFVKNQKPHNYKPIGSEFINSDGYVMIKIADPNIWILKQRYVYEQLHGTIPEGYSVIFANQNKNDFSDDNLLLVENKDKLVAKNKHLIYENKELTKTGLLIAKLINKTSDIKILK